MPVSELTLDPALYIGFDIGGTKINVLSSVDDRVRRYSTADYACMDDVLDAYFHELGYLPASVALAMAGPRDDETGAVKLTNGNWPAFEPLTARKRYPNTRFETINDMIGTAAGAFAEQGIDLTELKPGKPVAHGTKLVVAVSTGIGAAAAVWDAHAKRYAFMASEGGHIGIQPENDEEVAYLRHLQTEHIHVSAELALSGKGGIDSLIDHSLATQPTEGLAAAVKRAREASRPVGAVLLEFATEGKGHDQVMAHKILNRLGSMLGSAIRDLAVVFKATGGIYLTGSVILALGEYLAGETEFLQRFVHPGAVHDDWISKIPLYLVDDPNVAVKGALQIARDNNDLVDVDTDRLDGDALDAVEQRADLFQAE